MRPAVLALLALAAAGCGSDTDLCVSGTYWEGGDEGSPLMDPGQNCIVCHENREGPTYDIAGTVYQKDDEPDDCYGLDGVTVRITDSESQGIELTSNEAGNFFHEAAGSTITFPITATIVTNQGENDMVTPQDSGSCNDCHTAVGTVGAPGRVTIP